MKKEILLKNIEKMTSGEKEILKKLFEGEEGLDLAELIKTVKEISKRSFEGLSNKLDKNLKEAGDKESCNRLLNRLHDFFKKIMEDVEKSWKQALYELDVASDLIEMSKYSASAFHSQQAAEMGLKALYIYYNSDVMPEHNLFKLAKIMKLPDSIVQKASKLNPIYTRTRYFDARADDKIPAEQFDKNQANEYYNYAEEILRWLSQKLSLSMD